MFTTSIVDIYKTSRLKAYSITCFVVLKDFILYLIILLYLVFFTGFTRNNIKYFILSLGVISVFSCMLSCRPVYNNPSVVIRGRPFVHLLHFFHIPSNELVVINFPKQTLFQVIIIPILLACKTSVMGKFEKTSYKI